MDLLHSQVASRAEDKVEDFALGGMYGTKGFFFQQRRGHLNLRGFAGVDLEKLVREVDVDLLQLHIENITFCNLREEDLRYMTDPQVIKLFKLTQLTIEYLLYSQDTLVTNLNDLSKKYSGKKRSLAQKRREVAELEETNKHLRNQVKAKRQNIATLEDLLKETNKARERDLLGLKNKIDPVDDGRPNMIKLFIAGPEGLCIEFNEKSDSSVLHIQKVASQAFITRKQREQSSRKLYVKLVHKGKLLQEESSLRECGVNSGDTILAIVEQGEETKEEPPPAVIVQQSAPQPDKNLELIDFLTKEQETMRKFASDFQQSLKDLVNRPQEKNSDSDIIEKMDRKWGQFEHGMRNQLEAKLLEYQALLAAQERGGQVVPVENKIYVDRRQGNMGELENDGEGVNLDEIYNKLRTSATQINILENQGLTANALINDLSDARRRQQEEIEELRRMLRNRGEAAPPEKIVIREEVRAPAPSAEPQPKPAKVMQPLHARQQSIGSKGNKWNSLSLEHITPSAAMGPLEEKPSSTKGHAEIKMDVAPVKKPDVKPVPEKKQVTIVEEVKKPEPQKVEPPPPTTVDIIFPLKFNPDLESISKVDMTISLAVDLSTDALIFETRKAVANKAKVNLPKVVLKLGARPLFMELDLPRNISTNFNAKTAVDLAKKGELTVTIPKGTPLTNAQIDLLTASFEKSVIEDAHRASDSGPDEGKSSEGGEGKGGDDRRSQLKIFSAKNGSMKFKKRRNWDDEYDDEEERAALHMEKQISGRDPNEAGISSKAGYLSVHRPNQLYREVRNSLENALGDISDRDGLTDEEMKEKMANLKNLRESLPEEVHEHMRRHRGETAGAVAAAAIDSGSESGSASELLKHKSPRVSVDWVKSTPGGVAASTGSVGSSLRSSISLTPAVRNSQAFRESPGLQRDLNGQQAQLSKAFSTKDGIGVGPQSVRVRRSIADFDNEVGLYDHVSEDSPMLASKDGALLQKQQQELTKKVIEEPVSERKKMPHDAEPAPIASATASVGASSESNSSARDRYAKPPRRIESNALDSDEDSEEDATTSLNTNKTVDVGAVVVPGFEVGAEIEANFYNKGQFLPGKIRRVRNNGTLDVQYDDGEVEIQIPGELVRLKTKKGTPASPLAVSANKSSGAAPNPYAVGTAIEAEFRGEYYPATIVKDRGDNTFDILYDDGEKEQGVKKEDIRLKNAGKKPHNSSASSSSSPKRSSGIPGFQAGAKVDANYHSSGNWYPGTIKRDHGDKSFDIDYDDGEFESYVEIKRIHLAAQDIEDVKRGNRYSPDNDNFGATTSTINSADDSAVTGLDDGDSFFRPGGTGTIDVSSTIDTEGDNYLARRGGASGTADSAAPKHSSVAQAADKYEQQAAKSSQPNSRRGSGSKADTSSVAALSPFRHLGSGENYSDDNDIDDTLEHSMNSLALSDSNANVDEIMDFNDSR